MLFVYKMQSNVKINKISVMSNTVFPRFYHSLLPCYLNYKRRVLLTCDSSWLCLACVQCVQSHPSLGPANSGKSDACRNAAAIAEFISSSLLSRPRRVAVKFYKKNRINECYLPQWNHMENVWSFYILMRWNLPG